MRREMFAMLTLAGVIAVPFAGADLVEEISLAKIALDGALQNSVEPRLQWVVGSWSPVSNTFNVADTTQSSFVATSVAGGRAVYSVWSQGGETSGYEAHALWGYDPRSRQVRVFEVNTLGVAETHVGSFNGDDVLVLELRDSDTNRLLQRRVLSWAGDTLRMEAAFYSNGVATPYSLILVRQ